ncbi:MAG: hypothetical protein RSE23_04625, partial [Clostridia bacterium]
KKQATTFFHSMFTPFFVLYESKSKMQHSYEQILFVGKDGNRRNSSAISRLPDAGHGQKMP